jgi:hypothetical protein
MRQRLVIFGIAALLSVAAAAVELFLGLDLIRVANAIGSFALLLFVNLLVFWSILGWYFSFIDRPAGDFRANLRRVLEALGYFLAFAVLLTAFPLALALVGVAAPDWTIRLIQAAAWPTVVGLAALLLARTPSGLQFIRSATARISKVSVAGIDVELTEAAATNIHYSLETSFTEYRKRLNSEYDRQVRMRQVDDKLALVADRAVNEAFGDKPPPGYRCTIHVPDVLFAHTLYELLDYYPIGGGRGRTFSMRYGMIGRTWRLKDAERWQLEGDVFEGNKDPTVLLDKWSMTPAEAKDAAQAGITAFVSIVLREDPSKPAIGILYFDSKTARAFGENEKPEDFAVKALVASNEAGLTRDIAQLGFDMRRVGPMIEASK